MYLPVKNEQYILNESQTKKEVLMLNIIFWKEFIMHVG